MAQKTVLHLLGSGMVLDQGLFVALPATDMSEIISTIRAAGAKPLYIVDGAEAFFTPKVLVALIGQQDPRCHVVNQALGNFFTEKQISALFGNMADAEAVIQPQAAAEVQGDLIVNLGVVKQQGYSFQPVPEGWSITTHMSLGATKIKRKIKNAEGDGTLFYMSPEAFKSIWLHASKAWAGVEDAPLTMMVSTGVGYKQATVQDDRINIGGNYIRRYEIEQVAKYRGWAIPDVLAIAA